MSILITQVAATLRLQLCTQLYLGARARHSPPVVPTPMGGGRPRSSGSSQRGGVRDHTSCCIAVLVPSQASAALLAGSNTVEASSIAASTTETCSLSTEEALSTSARNGQTRPGWAGSYRCLSTLACTSVHSASCGRNNAGRSEPI